MLRLSLYGIEDRRAGLRIGVDGTVDSVLADMQFRRPLETDDHLTIRLPPLFVDVVGQATREIICPAIRVGAQVVDVVGSEGNDELVGGQKAFTGQRSDAGFGFSAQQGVDLLRHDRSPEHAGERIADARLKPALEPGGEALPASHVVARRPCVVSLKVW